MELRRWLVCSLLFAGCGDTILLVDPPVVFEQRPDAGTGATVPKLTLGIFSEQFFSALDTQGDLPIIAGFQGGDWVMPAIRADVLVGPVFATARLVTDDGEVVGMLDDAQDRLQPTAEGPSENVGLPIPIRHAADRVGDPIDDLYGRMATLTMTLKDAQQTEATVSLEVRLVED